MREAVGTNVGSSSRTKIKGSSIWERTWLQIDPAGLAQVVEAGKQSIMQRTGLPVRDLRLLDPLLSYPASVLARDKAIVFNLEHIKANITAHELLLLNFRDPSVTPLVHELQTRLVQLHQTTRIAQEGRLGAAGQEDDDHNGDDGQTASSRSREGFRVLPFEFVALEACLEAACSCLENDARTLEQEAQLALDRLTSKVTTLNLELVRQIKSRLVAITGRVQKVKDELERLLDDDEDMVEMFLTSKNNMQQLSRSSSSSVSSPSSVNEKDGIDEISQLGIHEEIHNTMNKNIDVEELEVLLEAYLLQIGGILNKLSTLREYVDDTEDYINIMLDDRQNNLLQMGVMLMTATLVISAYVVVPGIFGMNINIHMFTDKKSGPHDFLWVVAASFIAGLLFYASAIAWCKKKHLLD